MESVSKCTSAEGTAPAPLLGGSDPAESGLQSSGTAQASLSTGVSDQQVRQASGDSSLGSARQTLAVGNLLASERHSTRTTQRRKTGVWKEMFVFFAFITCYRPGFDHQFYGQLYDPHEGQ